MKKTNVRPKIVRDNFSLPVDDHQLIEALRSRLSRLGIEANKSEIVRSGLHAIAGMNDRQLVKALSSVEKIKAGRPPK